MVLKDFFSSASPSGDHSNQRGEFRFLPKAQFTLDPIVFRLDEDLRFLTAAFFEKLRALLPKDFAFSADKKAPPDANCTHESFDKKPPPTKLSIEFHHVKGNRVFKYGTARVELRGSRFFAKTVTWRTPKALLHNRNVYDLIKRFYPDSRIFPSKSKNANGFAIKNGRHIITLEVFGPHAESGFLACDLTLNSNNKPLAKQRLERFLEFYGNLYNMVGNPDLSFNINPNVGDGFDIELVEDYQSQNEHLGED